MTTGETIDVCQDCGEVIDPIRIPGTDKALVYCVSDACTLARIGPIPRLSVPDPDLAYRARLLMWPIIPPPDPGDLLRITGGT